MVTVGLNQTDYTVREDVGLLLVCVAVPDSRKLGTNLTLQLKSEARTAEGVCKIESECYVLWVNHASS